MRALDRSAIWKATALMRRPPWREADLDGLALLAHEPGVADDPDVGGDQEGPGVADPVRFQLLDRLDDLEGQLTERHLGVDCERLGQLLGVEGTTGSAPRTASANGSKCARGNFRPAAAAWPPKVVRPAEQAWMAS